MGPGVSRGRISRRTILIMSAAVAGGLVALVLATSAHPILAAPLTHLDPTPTTDVQIIPTIAVTSAPASNGGSVSTSSSGIALAVTLSCITTVAGLVIFAGTLVALLRTGYGPFLRALISRRKGSKDAAQGKEQPTLRYQPGSHSQGRALGPETGFDIYAEPPSRGRGATRRPSRDEWDDWDDRPPRQSRPSRSGASSRSGRRY